MNNLKTYKTSSPLLPAKHFYLKMVLGLSVCLSQSVSHSKNTGELYFPAEHNGTSLLSQKFEFHITSKDTIQLGNLLIRSQDIQVNLNFNKEEKEYELEFKGPSQFIKNSTLILRDPSGRSIWQKETPPTKDLKTTRDTTLPEDKINEVSSFIMTSGVDDFLEAASGTLFVNFCSFFEDPLHKINICSPDYKFVQVNETEWKQELLPPSNKDPIIQVNGIEVNEIGQIQLSKDIPVIQYSARLVSGMLIEIRTGIIPIELLDLIFLETEAQDVDKKPEFVKLTLREKQTTENYIEKNIWESKVNLKNPFLYIQAENQVPLKQEVKFNSELPSAKERPSVAQDIQKTYEKSVEIELENVKGTLRTLTPKDNAVRRGQSWFWNLRNLIQTKSTPHLIELTNKNGQKFVGAYEVRRGYSFLTNMSLNYGYQTWPDLESDKNLTSTGYKLGGKYHFTSFFGNINPMNLLHWTFDFEIESSQLTGETKKISQLDSTFALGYRINSGFHHETPSFEIQLLQQVGKNSISINNTTFTSSGMANSMGLGLIYNLPFIEPSSFFGQQVNFGVKYLPSIKYSHSTESYSQTNLSIKSYHTISTNWFWTWEFQQRQNKYFSHSQVDFGISSLY